MRRLIQLLALGVCVLATGCASVSGGNVQKMYVQTQGPGGIEVVGADCVLSNDKGNWRLRTPGDTSIVRSNKNMEVKCDKSPLPQGVVSVESGTRGAMFGNIIIGGVVGAVIDHSSGAAYEYPEMIKVVMGRMTSMNVPKGGITNTAAAPGTPGGQTRIPPAQMASPVPPPMQAQAPVVQTYAAPPPQTSQPAMMASGYANIEDVDALPYLSERGRQAYRDWLTKPTPKAFAISTVGSWYPAWGATPGQPGLPIDTSERAVQGCSRNSSVPCRLYAVNGSVVWTRDSSAAAPMAAAMPMAAPAPVVQPVAYAPPAAVAASRKAHARAVPAASGFADASNADAVPLSAEGKARYAHYLTLPTPKAFVVYESGGWRFWFNSPDAMATLLDTCAREGRKCWLYAVDNQVVWREDLAQRVGRADQLAR